MKLQNLYLFSKIYSIDNGKDTNRTQNRTQEKQSSFLLYFFEVENSVLSSAINEILPLFCRRHSFMEAFCF